MPGVTIANPNGAYGYTDLQTKLPYVTGEYKTSAAVSAKRVVAIGTTGLVATAATNGTASLAFGVSLRAIGSGSTGSIIEQGIAESCAADGAIAAGDLVKRSVNTAGYVQATATPAAGEVIGVAIAASASNLVNIRVLPGKALS